MSKPKAFAKALVNISRIEGEDVAPICIVVRRTDKPGVVIRLEIAPANFAHALTGLATEADVTQWGGASFDNL